MNICTKYPRNKKNWLTMILMYYRKALQPCWSISIFVPTLTKSFNLQSMINEIVNRGREFFAYFFNQSTGVSNGIFKHFKLEINKESKAFKRTRNRQRNSHNKLHKRVSWILLDKSKAVFRWLHRLPFQTKYGLGEIKISY